MATVSVGLLAIAALAPHSDLPVAAVLPPWCPEARWIAAATAETPIVALGRAGVVVLAPGGCAPGALVHLSPRPGDLCLATWHRT